MRRGGCEWFAVHHSLLAATEDRTEQSGRGRGVRGLHRSLPMPPSDRRLSAQGVLVFFALIGLSCGCTQAPTSPTRRAAVVRAAATRAQMAAAVTGPESPLADAASARRNPC